MKCDVVLNISASLPRVYFTGSSFRSRRISSICSDVTRGGGLTYAEGRRSGGREFSDLEAPGGRRSGDEGSSVVENGVGAVGGGRWMNVKLSSSRCWTPDVLLLFSGSVGRGGGLCAL